MTQTEAILEYLNEYQSITPVEAIKHIGCFRLAARIHDLEKKGYVVPRETVKAHSRKTGETIHFSKYFKPV